MKLSPEEAKILREAMAGIPLIAETIAATHGEHRTKALEAAERGYLQTLRQSGFADHDALTWVSAIMRRLRGQVEVLGLVNKRMLAALYEELSVPPATMSDQKSALVG